MKPHKYLVVPGYVTSQTDGQTHWVTCEQLIRLYGVNPQECLLIGEQEAYFIKRYPNEHSRNCIILRPRYDGNYDLTKAESVTP